MALPKEKLLYTVEQYLEMERASEERHVYYDRVEFPPLEEQAEEPAEEMDAGSDND